MSLEKGHVIAGTLRLVRKIADGGMGSVWRAEHLVLRTGVAVKVLARQWACVPSARTRLLREAQMTAGIDDPHVVRVLDCRFSESDEPYLVLELLRGDNLEQRVRRRGTLSLLELEAVVAQTSAALSAAHDAGVIHRDVKPENVCVAEGPGGLSVKLLDFGVARPKRLADCVDVDRLPAGTPSYMSPEHAFEPESLDERSDLFSLGAVAYFAATGRPPFDADSPERLFLAMEDGKFKRVTSRRRDLPAALDDWFAKALARAPEDRFRTAREMADALHAVVDEASRRRARAKAAVTRRAGARLALAAALAVMTAASLFFLSSSQRGVDVQNAVASPPGGEPAEAGPPVGSR